MALVVLRESPGLYSTCIVVSVRLSRLCELRCWTVPSTWVVWAGFRRNLHLESSLNDPSAGLLDYGSGIFRLCSPPKERHIWSSIRRPARDVREGYGRPLRGSSRSEGCGLSGTLRRDLVMRAVSCEGCPRRCLWWQSVETGRFTRWRRRAPERAGPWACCPQVAATTTSRLSGWARVSGGRWRYSSRERSALWIQQRLTGSHSTTASVSASMPRSRPVSPGRLRISGGQDGTCGRSGGYSRIFGATRPGSSSTVRSSRRRQYLSLWPWAPRTARYFGSRLRRYWTTVSSM